MVTRLEIQEVVWRGPWILVIFPNKDHREMFAKATIKVYWANECKAMGAARTFYDVNEKGNSVMLDIVEVYNPSIKALPPTSIEISLDGEKITLPITLATKKEIISGVWENEESAKQTGLA